VGPLSPPFVPSGRPTTAAVHLFVKNTEAFFETLYMAGYNYRPEN
jgi:hypothetical protein